jgi:hypothetical protein
MDHETSYASPAAVEQAIKAAANQAFCADASISVDERIRLEHFHRFLSRIFSQGGNHDWVLKGGTGMLARIPSARATMDIDLYNHDQSLDKALTELRRLASIDLGDFFRFQFTGYSKTLIGTNNDYTNGYQVNFDVYIGVQKKRSFHVDLVTATTTTDDVEISTPANALNLPKLKSYPYRLYPVADQIADKVCATIALYNGKPSSREKDLVDLVIMATTYDIDAAKLRKALVAEKSRRSLTLPTVFPVPASWGTRYAKLAHDVPACSGYRHIDAAKELMKDFLDPILGTQAGTSAAKHAIWSHVRCRWDVSCSSSRPSAIGQLSSDAA